MHKSNHDKINAANYQKNKVIVSLNIYGYPDGMADLTAKIGLQPDKALEKGDKPSRNHPGLAMSFWSFNSKLSEGASPEDHIAWLIEKLRPKKTILSSIAETCEIKIAVGAYYYFYNVEVELDPGILREIGEIGAKLWFDTYCFQRSYLEELFQREKLIRVLATSEAAKELGITTENEREAITETLHLFEKYASHIPANLFPDYGDNSDIDNEDMSDALLLIRERLSHIRQSMDGSQFLSSSQALKIPNSRS